MNNTWIISALTIVIFSHAVYGMEGNEKEKTPAFRIKNDTKDKIEIFYAMTGNNNADKFKHLTLIPKQSIYLTRGHLERLTDMYVGPYGSIKGLGDASRITLGVWKRTNLATLTMIKEAFKSKCTFGIAIKLGTGSYFPTCVSRYTFSYEYEIIDFHDDEFLAQYFYDFFPQVRDAKLHNKPIEARYFLNVGKDADGHSIVNAWDLQQMYWKWRGDVDKTLDSQLLNNIFTVLFEAHRSLRGTNKVKAQAYENLQKIIHNPAIFEKEYLLDITPADCDLDAEFYPIAPKGSGAFE